MRPKTTFSLLANQNLYTTSTKPKFSQILTYAMNVSSLNNHEQSNRLLYLEFTGKKKKKKRCWLIFSKRKRALF